MRMNWALLTALLCYAAAPAATCDPRDQLSPLNEPEWTLAEQGRTTTSRALVAPNSPAEDATRVSDAMVVLTGRLAVANQPAEISAPASGLPSTSTAPDREPESGLR
jgi:hypothetical protein